MKNDGPLSFIKTWEGFLPPNAVVMSRRHGEAPEEASTEQGAGLREVRFAFVAPGIENPAFGELFKKIIAALGLGEGEIWVSSTEANPLTSQGISAESVICFTLGENDRTDGWNDSRLVTYSLAAMSAKPELKKTVWTQLKSGDPRR